MTELQLKIMKWSDLTPTKGCLVRISRGRILTIIDDPEIEIMMNHTRKTVYCFSKEHGSRSCRDIDIKDIEQKIGKPYGIGRILGLHRTYDNGDSQQVAKFKKVREYARERHLESRECIYWPEEGQKVVEEFLDCLNKGNVPTGSSNLNF